MLLTAENVRTGTGTNFVTSLIADGFALNKSKKIQQNV